MDTETEDKNENLDSYRDDARRSLITLVHLATNLLSNGPFFPDDAFYEIAIIIEDFATSLRKAAEKQLEETKEKR